MSKRMVAFLVILLSSTLVSPAIATSPTANKKNTHNIDIHILKAQAPVGQIYGSNIATQTFTSHVNNMDEVAVLFATYGGHRSGVATVSMSQVGGQSIFTQTLDISKMKDNSFISFKFPAVGNSANKKYVLTVANKKSTIKNSITIWSMTSNFPTGFTSSYAGKPYAGVLVFNTYSN